MSQVKELKDIECAVDCFIFHIPHGWKLIWKCGNVRPEFVRAQKLLQSPEDFVEFAKLLLARGKVEVNESLSPMFYAKRSEKNWVFSEIGRLAQGQIEVLFGLSNMVYSRWGAFYEDRRRRMEPLAKSLSPLDFFLLFDEGGVALFDEVMMRDEIEKIVRPKVYSHTEESQDVAAYLVASDPEPTLAAGDEGWAMALAACIVAECNGAIPHDRSVSPVVPSDDWIVLLEDVSKGMRQSLYQLVGLVKREWSRAAQFCRMLDDTGMPEEVNAALKGRGVPPCSMHAYHHRDEICPLIVDIMSNHEARGLVRPRKMAGDVESRALEKLLLGLPEDNEERVKFTAQCLQDEQSISTHHEKCVVWAKRRGWHDARLAALAANYFSRLPYSVSRISLRWGMVKVMGGTLKDYVRFSEEEKKLGMRDMEQETVIEYDYDFEGATDKSPNFHPRYEMIDKPDPIKSKEVDEAGRYHWRLKHLALMETIEWERYVLSKNDPEGEPERNRLRREREERIARFRARKSKKGI